MTDYYEEDFGPPPEPTTTILPDLVIDTGVTLPPVTSRQLMDGGDETQQQEKDANRMLLESVLAASNSPGGVVFMLLVFVFMAAIITYLVRQMQKFLKRGLLGEPSAGAGASSVSQYGGEGGSQLGLGYVSRPGTPGQSVDQHYCHIIGHPAGCQCTRAASGLEDGSSTLPKRFMAPPPGFGGAGGAASGGFRSNLSNITNWTGRSFESPTAQ